MPRFAGQYRNFFRRLNAAALQGFAQNGLFEGKLRFIVGVLIVAAAAGAEVRTGGANALRCGGDDFIWIGGIVAALALRNAHAGLFAR